LHTSTAGAAFTGVTPVNVAARAVSIASHVVLHPISIMQARPVLIGFGLILAVGLAARLLFRSPHDGMVRCLGLALLFLALLSPVVWAWYVTWGVVVLATVAAGRLRTGLIVISTFWAFAGVTSIHAVFMRMIHTFVLPDLLLGAALLAITIVPLSQFGGEKSRLPRITPGSGDADPYESGSGLVPGVAPVG
jgi:hypothetical protein